MAKAPSDNGPDGEGRRLGERTGLDTPVVPAVKDAGQALDGRWGPSRTGGKPLSPPPGKYGRKAET